MQTGGRSLWWSVLCLPYFGLFLLFLLTTPLSARRPQSDRRIPERTPAATATVQGVIRDAHGRGIPGVQLDLQSTGNAKGNVTAGGQHYSITTNVEGIFRLRDVRLGVYEVKLTREGFEAQTISSFQVIHPVSMLELSLKASSEPIPPATCPS